MVTLTSACLGVLLAWLAASDSRLPWLSRRNKQSSQGKNPPPHKNTSQMKTQNTDQGRKAMAKMELENLHGFLRLAAYAAMAALLWSWPPPDTHHHQQHLNEHVHPAEPSFRVDVDPLNLPSESFPRNSDAVAAEKWAATGEAQTGDDWGSSSTSSSLSDEEAREAAHVAAIHNATLGFEKIFVVNLPERTDKRDALSLVSALTDIKLTWTSALRGTSVPDKALPLGVDRKGWRDGGIGSWRSQMNAIRT